MKINDLPQLKALNKVAPDLLAAMIAQGVREFAEITVEGAAELSWFGTFRPTPEIWSDLKYATAIASAKPAFGQALTATPSIVVERHIAHDSLSNCRYKGVSRNVYQAMLNNNENNLNITTSMPIHHVLNGLIGSSMVGKTINNTRVAVCSLASDGKSFLTSICAMFGTQLHPTLPVTVEAADTDANLGSITALNSTVSAWPNVILRAAPPGVQFLHVSVPNALQGDAFFLGSQSSYGPDAQKFHAEYDGVDSTVLSGLRSLLNNRPQAGTFQVSGDGIGFHIAIPIISAGTEWCRSWRSHVKQTYPTTPMYAAVWHTGYVDTRYGNERTDLYRPLLNASITNQLYGDAIVGLNGQVMTDGDLGLHISGQKSSATQYFMPVFGPLGPLPLTVEGTLLDGEVQQFTLDEYPDRNFTLKKYKFMSSRLAMRVTYEWYEKYHTTGLGVYNLLPSSEQQATLKRWRDSDMNGIGLAAYSTPMPISSTLIEELQIRKEYKRRKEKACETDDFYKSVDLVPGTRWETVKGVLDKAGSRAMFFAPVFSSPTDFDYDYALETETVRYVRNDVDGPVQRITSKIEELSPELARSRLIEDMLKGSSVTYTGWDPALTQDEISAMDEMKQEYAYTRIYADGNLKFVGVNMAEVYQFPWESLGNSGYPMVKEMPRQNAIMSIIHSLVFYDKFGSQAVKLLNKLSSGTLINKINSK